MMDELADALFDPFDEDVRIATVTPPGGGAPFDVPVRLRTVKTTSGVLGQNFVSRVVQVIGPYREMQDARQGATVVVEGRSYTVKSYQDDGAVSAFLDLAGPTSDH